MTGPPRPSGRGGLGAPGPARRGAAGSRRRGGGLGAAALACAGCVTAPAVSPSFKLRSETQPECAALCEQMGMWLGAVVLIHNAAGCVCEPREVTARPAEEAAPRARPGGGAATAGGALVFALERAEEERRRDEADRQRRDDEDRRRRDDEDRRRRHD